MEDEIIIKDGRIDYSAHPFIREHLRARRFVARIQETSASLRSAFLAHTCQAA